MAPDMLEQRKMCTVFTDGSSNSRGSVVDLILNSDTRLVFKASLHFKFPTNNNKAKYEAFIVGLTLVFEMRAKETRLWTNSLLVVSQVKGEALTKVIRATNMLW